MNARIHEWYGFKRGEILTLAPYHAGKVNMRQCERQHAFATRVYWAIGQSDKTRQDDYRTLIQSEFDRAGIEHIPFALHQNLLVGNERFYAKIYKKTGLRGHVRPRARPRLEDDAGASARKDRGSLFCENNRVHHR